MSINKLNNESFETTIQNSTKPLIVDFYAEWCGPCKMIAPILDEIVRENDNFEVFKLDIDECPDIASEFSVMTVPSLIAFKNGKEYRRIVGAQSKDNILALVN